MRIILLVLFLSGCATSPYIPGMTCTEAVNAPRYQQTAIDNYLWGAIEARPNDQREAFLMQVMLACRADPNITLGDALKVARRSGQ